MAAEKKLAEEKGAVEETRGGRKRRVSRVGLEQGSHRLSNDPVGQVKYVIEDASEEDDEPPPPPRRRKQAGSHGQSAVIVETLSRWPELSQRPGIGLDDHLSRNRSILPLRLSRCCLLLLRPRWS